MLLPSEEDLSAENVTLILEVIRDSGYLTVHYTGRADENLLRGLLGMQPALEVSGMDMPDRWKSGSRYFWDEREACGSEYPECPDWLEGILFYQEGASEHEIAIRDWPWHSSDQMDRIIRSNPRRPPPKLWILFGFADMTEVGFAGIGESGEWERGSMLGAAPFRHKSYDWKRLGEIWVGRRIPGQPPLEPYPDDDDEYYDEEDGNEPPP